MTTDADRMLRLIVLEFNPRQGEKDQEILTLKQHIHILQQEHLAKISRIAELEAQLQYVKVIVL